VLGSRSAAALRVGKWAELLSAAAYPDKDMDAVVELLTTGARMGVTPTPAGCQPVVRRSVSNSSSAIEHASIVRDHVRREVELERVVCLGRRLPPSWTEPYVSPIGVIPKPRSFGKYRRIHNMSHGGRWSVNGRIPAELGAVQYISHRDVAARLLQLGRGAWLFGFDVEDAFRHVSWDARDLQYSLFVWEGELYVDTRVGFGSRTGPAIYDRLGRALVAIMRHHGIDLLRMVDDHLGGAAERDAALVLQMKANLILAILGMPRAISKDVGPVQAADFTGIRWDMRTLAASIPEAKWAFMVAELEGLLGQHNTSLDAFRSAVGRLMSVVTIVPEGKARLQACYAVIWVATQRLVGGRPGRREPHGAAERCLLELPEVALLELGWWRRRLGASYADGPSRPFAHIVSSQTCDLDPGLPDVTVSCDASGLALGAVWGRHWSHSPIPPHIRVGQAGQAGSTLVELGALLLACLTWGDQWRGRRVRLLSDNSGAVAIWAKQHSRLPELAAIVRSLSHVARVGGYWLGVGYIPGVVNVAADAVSRLRWQVLRAAVEGVDAFASPCLADPLSPWDEPLLC